MKSGARITVAEIAERLSIGRLAAYQLLEKRVIPAIRLGRRWIITWHAYLHWEQTCGKEINLSTDKMALVHNGA
jgi:excisionase family DNA binding protein